MQIVMVEFAVGEERVDACIAALSELMNGFVAKQPTFHGATIHVEKSAGTVVNYMRWDTHQAFIDFRDSNAGRIGAALGEFGPQGRMLDVVAEIPEK